MSLLIIQASTYSLHLPGNDYAGRSKPTKEVNGVCVKLLCCPYIFTAGLILPDPVITCWDCGRKQLRFRCSKNPLSLNQAWAVS